MRDLIGLFITAIVIVTGALLLNTAQASPAGYEHAKKYLGLHEVTDNVTLRRVVGVDPAKIPWCAYFISKMEQRAGYNIPTTGWARDFLKFGTPVKLNDAKKGDIVIFTRGPKNGHVAYYVRVEGDYIVTLGGNQGNSVKYSKYHKSRLLGVRRL